MRSITVTNIPDKIYNKTRVRAEAHRRNMNSEIIACLEQTVESYRASDDEILQEARRLRKKVKGSLSSREIEAAINQRKL